MKFNYELCEEISNFIKDAKLEEISIGCSDSQVFKIEKEDNVYFLKVANLGLLTSEYNALKWLDGKLLVPKIVLYTVNNEIEFLITEKIPGEMVCSDNIINDYKKGLKVIVEAFNNIYDVDIKNCPFDVSLDYKLNLVKSNVDNGLINYDELSENTKSKFKNLNEILDYLFENRFEEELCFSHGDTSLPNIFCNNGKFSGFIDVGECGIADKWFDLAICQKSIKRNYGENAISEFYSELNIVPDNYKINYYLLMMELYL